MMILFQLLFPVLLFANTTPVSEVHFGNRLERSYDINSDGKVDYVEITVDKELTQRKEDLDFDGEFDLLTTFSPESSKYNKIVEQKKYSQGPRKRISFWDDLETKKTFALTQIDDNNDGVWDREFTMVQELNQHKEICELRGLDRQSFTNVENVARHAALAARKAEFTDTDFGYSIHKSCLAIGEKDWFLNNAKRAIMQGQACLNQLAKDGGKGAAKNSIGLTNLLKDTKVELVCNETTYDWGNNTLAHATTGKTEATNPLRHPAISFNPAFVMDNSKGPHGGDNEFVKTVFHEQFHNLGFKHGDDIEYSYTCETCCFPTVNDSKALKDSSCKICKGNYTGITDINYLKDISRHGQDNYDSEQAFSTSIAYLKENPGNLDGMSYLSLNLSGYFDPIGGMLAEKVLVENGITEEQIMVLNKARQHNDSELLKPYEPSARVIADAYFESYKGNPGSALKLLKENAKVIKDQLAREDNRENVTFVKDGLKKKLNSIIYDIWVFNHYGASRDEKQNKEMSNLAFELEEEFGF